MSRKYKFRDPDGVYFVTFGTVYWIDVFSRPVYKDILVESINYCVKEKGLVVYAWVIMTNHVHMIISSEGEKLEDILRDLKKFTAKTIIQEIKDNPKESRKDWMLWIASPEYRDLNEQERSYHIIHNTSFGSSITNLLHCIQKMIWRKS
ncbi:MAG TPA: transposase [Bacteroidales bacterium]|nr:transposase [Bacteroidales bacterium]